MERKQKLLGGRPSKFTPELIKKALELAGSLVSERTICHALGIEQDTFIRWKHLAKEGSKPHREFFGHFRRIRAEHVIKLYRKIQVADDWRAHAWLIEKVESADRRDDARDFDRGTGCISVPVQHSTSNHSGDGTRVFVINSSKMEEIQKIR